MRKPDLPPATAPHVDLTTPTGATPSTMASPDHPGVDTKPTEAELIVVPGAPVPDKTAPLTPVVPLKHDTGIDTKDGDTSDSTIKGDVLAPTLKLQLKNDTGRGIHEYETHVFVVDRGLDEDGITKDGTLTVKGLQDGEPWQFSVDGGAHWIDGSGSEIAADALGADGTKTVMVRRVDADGRAGGSEFTFVLDTAPPLPVGLQLVRDDGVDEGDFVTGHASLRVMGREEGAAVGTVERVRIVHGEVDEVPVLDYDGLHRVVAIQTDVAGNLSEPGPAIMFYLDRAAAVVAPKLSGAAVLHGTTGADTFQLKADMSSTFVLDYDAQQKDVLDLSEILSVPKGASIYRFVQVVRDGADIKLTLDPGGSAQFSTAPIFIDLANQQADAPVVLHTANGGVFTV
ncbi:hypothetical protein ABE85_03640 [Mitsuaria sp. 7]|nr:hypothetical protein ABE85_03640 [Mitsuaria sp. 7]